MCWIYANGGRSLFLAVLFHAMINTSYNLFPNAGSPYNPGVVAAAVLIMAGTAAFLRPILPGNA